MATRKRYTYDEFIQIYKDAMDYRENQRAMQRFKDCGYLLWGYVKDKNGGMWDKDGNYVDWSLMFRTEDGSEWFGEDWTYKAAKELGLLDWTISEYEYMAGYYGTEKSENE